MSRGRGKRVRTTRTASLDDLHTSNLTTGHFLGTLQRDWMLSAETNTPSTSNPSLIQRTARKNVTQTQRLSTNPNTLLQPRPTADTPNTNPTQAVPPQTSKNITSTSSALNVAPSVVTNAHAFAVNAVAPVAQTIPLVDVTNVSEAYPSAYGSDSCVIHAIHSSPPVLISALPRTGGLNNRMGDTRYDDQNIAHVNIEMPQQLLVSLPDLSVDAAQAANHNFISTPISSTLRRPIVASAASTHALTVTLPQHSQGQSTGHIEATIGPIMVPYHGGTASAASDFVASPTAVAHPAALQLLKERFAAIEATQRLSAVDQIRKSWLIGACTNGDFFYMVLHQLSCIQTVFPQYLMTHLGFLKCHVDSLLLLSSILADNRKITPPVMKLFCNFFDRIVDAPLHPSIQAWMPHTKYFLETFEVRWSNIKHNMTARGSPPCARELNRELQSDGIVLSQAVYAHFFYQLFPRPSSAFTGQSFALFKASQDYFLERRRRGVLDTSQDMTYEQELAAFALKFLMIARKYNTLPIQNVRALRPQTNPIIERSALNTGTQPPTAAMQALSNRRTAINPAAPSHHPVSLPISATLNNTRPNAQVPTCQRAANYLVPARGHILPITVHPDPSRIALHQIHLSDPPVIRSAIKSQSSQDSTFRFYSFLKCFVGDPKIIGKDTVFETWSVDIGDHLFQSRARDSDARDDHELGRRGFILQNGRSIFQLRCIDVINKPRYLDESECSPSATYWPEHIFISINDIHLEFRRKTHYGKDLPVNIHHIIQKGSNELKLSYHASKRTENKSFAIILEAITVLDHAECFRLPKSINAKESLTTITQSLQNNHQDDDLVMTDARISIDLIDPFTARIFDQPVKGQNCKHRECFDLESFLQSRSCRNKDDFVHSDEWRCPLCGKDARPTSLVVDQFLLGVKEELIANNKSDTKAILVNDDGTWEPKPEAAPVSDVGQPTSPIESRSARLTLATVDAKLVSGGTVEAPTVTEDVVVSLVDIDD